MLMHVLGLRLQILAACAALCLSGAAHAVDPPFEIVDPGMADVSGAAYQMRVFPVDLSPHGLLRTYKVPGRNDLLMRTNGALFAVFDESQYKRDRSIKKATVWRHGIPANTVFYIGKPDFKSIRSAGIRAVNLRVDDQTLNSPLRESSALDSVGGVERVAAEHLGERYEQGSKLRKNLRLDLRAPESRPEVSEDKSYPPVRHVDPSEFPRPLPTHQDPASALGNPTRPERPHLGDRISSLMRRASKDS
jgi:hypothetical protein